MKHPLNRLLLVGLMSTYLACGASSDLEGEQQAPTGEEACILASDAEWKSGDCGGAFDQCGLIACENVIGDGCDCLEPEMCWTGSECVPE